MWRFAINTRHLLVSLMLCLPLTLSAGAALNEQGVEIDADQFTTNILTSQSILEGNVILRHQGMVIRCGLAEIFPEGGEESQPRYLLKDQLALAQQTDQYQLSAQAGQATYLPLADELILDTQVQFQHIQSEQAFDISADNLKVLQKDGQLDQLIAMGEPTTFTQTFDNKRVEIKASRIDWIAETQTALMKDASLNDGTTTFSASEIEYNTTTGAISAKGQGDERPKYRFNSQNEEKKETTTDDT